MMCDSVPPEQEEGQCGFKPTLCSAVCYKYLSSVLRTQTYMGDVSQTSYRALLWPARALPRQSFTKQLQHRRKPGLL